MQENKQLYCPIRRTWVAALPEEHVRQFFIQHMVGDCHFPQILIAVEKSLKQLPHLHAIDLCKIPDRRADIICFANKEDRLFPLLIVECKAIKLTKRVVNQVASYNRFVRAPFIAIVNLQEIRFGTYDLMKDEYTFIDHLPDFKHLCSLGGLYEPGG